MFKQVSNPLKSSIKSGHQETEVKQTTNQNKQANPSFPYLAEDF